MHYLMLLPILLAVGLTAPLLASELPDLHTIAPDLDPPSMFDSQPVAGLRVKQVASDYRETDVYHSLYLPTDWQPGNRYPLIVEFAGNGPYENNYGDVCTGKVEDCNLGYGISGGKGFIWVCLPYVSRDHSRNQLEWWGDVEATVSYCKKAVQQICQQYGGDPTKVLLTGFSRGSIACNFIGLHDDQIATLWCGFICHGHYDGVREWDYPESTGQSAAARLKRLAGRPQFISHERSIDETRKFLSGACPDGDFTFQAIPHRNHTDTWVLRDIPEREVLRKWVAHVLERNGPAKKE